MEAGAAGGGGGVEAVEAELFDGAAGAGDFAGEGVCGSVDVGGDADEGVDGVAALLADFVAAGEVLAVVIHPLLEIGLDGFEVVVVEAAEGGVSGVDGFDGAVAELGEIEDGGEEVAFAGEFPAPGYNFSRYGFEVAEVFDSEGAGVACADGVVAGHHRFAIGGSGLKLPRKGSLVLGKAVEKIELLREDAAADRDPTIFCFFGAEIWISFRHEL